MTPKERLLELRRVIEKHFDPEKFDMSQWLTIPFTATRNPQTYMTPDCIVKSTAIPATCGTTACVFGYASMSEALYHEGLRFYVEGSVVTPHLAGGDFHPLPTTLIKSFFGIGTSAMTMLFYSDIHPDDDAKKVILARIDAVLANPMGYFNPWQNPLSFELGIDEDNYDTTNAYEELREERKKP